MLGKAPTPTVVALIIGFGVVFAMPLAGAFGVGVDAASVPTIKSAGASPAYGQTWVGKWMNQWGWGGLETDLRTLRDQGVTPVVMWYYWGDGISVNAVQYGKDGMSRAQWDSMAREMASRSAAVMGERPFLVVLEPEFNKAGVQDWETFDGYLENQARIIRAAAPHAQIVVGFGHWGGWERFDRAVAASDYTGFQILRGSTRDTSSQAIAAADDIIRISKALKGLFGKDVVVFDLGIATYGGWEWVQEAALQRIIAKRGEIDAAGVQVLVWRYVFDNDHSSGYYGPAESSWGVKYRSGGAKKGYDELLTLVRGGSSAAPAPTTGSSGSVPSAPFRNVKGNDWWIQADVDGGPSRVETRVNGGSWKALSKQSWGAYALSTHAPTGSVVELRATWGSGQTAAASYRWPDATPASATTGGANGYDARFGGVKVQAWWVQVDVQANELSRVEARVNGGAWIPLEKQWWGSWAKSIHVPAGGKVEFRALSTSGASAISGATWR